jgi:heme exporter protein B
MPAAPPPGTVRQAWLLLRREVTVELSGRAVLTAVVPFVAVGMVLAGLGFGPDPQRLREVAPGTVWLLVLAAAVPAARLAGAADRDDGAWDVVRGLARPTAVLAAKVGALWLLLFAAWSVAAVLAAVLLGAPPTVAATAAGLLGTLGVATVTAVYGTLLAADARHAAVLAVLVLPASLPAMVGGVAAWSGAAPGPWLALLAAHAAVALVTAWAVFPTVLQD